MVRPRRGRWIGHTPGATFFKPAGIPAATLRITRVDLDELEAMRLVDHQGLQQTEAAKQMGISQSTVARLLASGRKKVVQALVSGEALEIQPGSAPITYGLPPFIPTPGWGGGRGCGQKGFSRDG